jgi:acyl-CoA synthetase (AMP-forming)/AMP-acid ligase II
VSRFEQPRDIKIVETIPRNPAGNVVRKELKSSYDVAATAIDRFCIVNVAT